MAIKVLIGTPALNGASGVQTVTGDGVNNTDPSNPVVSFPDNSEIVEIRPLKTVGGESLEGTGNIEVGSNEYGYLDTYDITDLQIDKNYVLSDYALTSDIVIGFDTVSAKVGRCVYFKVSADGVSKINFNTDNTASLTGINNGEILEVGEYTFVAIFNGFLIDVSVAAIDENLTPIAIPEDGLEVFFDFINQSTLTIDGGLITQADNIATPSYFANQSTTGFKPTFDAVDGAVLDGTDDFISSNVPSTLMDINSDYTLFIVYKNDTPNSASDILSLYENASSTSNYNAGMIRFGTLRQGIYEVGGVGFVSKSIASSENTRHVSFFENTNKVTNLELDSNPSTGTDTIYTGGGVSSTLQLGALGGAQAQFLKGSIEKVILYNRVLTSGEKTQVLNYLNS